jgi:hypothetical protein
MVIGFKITGNVGSTSIGGLRAISCLARKLPERKDAHRKPLLPNLRVTDIAS